MTIAQRFSPATLKVIEALHGDPRTGKCLCPCHDDGRRPSLQINDGHTVPVVVHCFGKNTRAHDLEVIAKLKRINVWPTSTRLSPDQISEAAERNRSPNERKKYAIDIWNALKRSNGHRFAPMVLGDYLKRRGINKVPTLAMATLPIAYPDSEITSHDPGMVLPIGNSQGKLRGVHVTWLNANLTAKRDRDPPRQCYGLLRDNFVVLTKIDYANPPETLLIGEGVETVLTAMQLTGLPGIATSGWWNMVNPPHCQKYIVLADNGDAGKRGAKELAEHLLDLFPDSTVQIATPTKPEGGTSGYDWNDALIDAINNRTSTATLRDAIVDAPVFGAENEENGDDRLNELASLDPISYDQQRAAAAQELGIRTKTLDEEVAKRRDQQHQDDNDRPAEEVDVEALVRSARDIIASENVLDDFAKDFGKLYVGEQNNAKLLYLNCTSRLFGLQETMHGVVKGPSAVGKSGLLNSVTVFMPKESVFRFTSLSEKALLYLPDGGDLSHKILLMAEVPKDEKQQQFQNLMLRELMSEGILRYPVVQKIGDENVTITIEVKGPVAFLVSTTKTEIDPENETRMLSIELDDSPDQTKAVMRKVARREGWNLGAGQIDFTPWHDFQRWLATGETCGAARTR